MAKSPDQIVADIDRKQNEEDLDLPKRAGKAIVKGAKKIYGAATSKGEDFEPKTAYMDGNFAMPTTEPVRSPVDVGAGVRSLNMGKKSAVGSEGIRSGMKKGGKVAQLAKANGIAQRGKTRGTMC
jgi:hypothetical protein